MACLVDDLVVFAGTQEQHDQRLMAVLRRLEEHHVTLNREKCKFSVKEVHFLGQIVNENGVCPDKEKIQAIADMERRGVWERCGDSWEW